MGKYGLIGYPVSHSFSKKYFTEKFKQLNLSCKYSNFELKSIDEFPLLLCQNPDISGLNITIPYKEAILPYLDKIEKQAACIGAVNTLKIEKKENKKYLSGFNTDVYGFEKSLLPMLQPQHQKALVLGTGGSARAVKYVLNKLKIKFLEVSRNPQNPFRISYAELDGKIIAEHLLLINTTPLGLYPHITEAPPLPYTFIGKEHLLVDLIYNPAETLFLKSGRKQGAKTLNGLKMLHLQAEKSWEIWTEKT